MKYIECLRKGCPRLQDDDEGLKCLDKKEPCECEFYNTWFYGHSG